MKAVLVDVTKCKGCMACAKACVESKGRERNRTDKGESALSATQLSTVVQLVGGDFAKKSCMHCLEPNCVAACLVGAIEKTPDGPVRYEADKCIGCRYCMLACPFHIPRYQWKSTEPLMKKCDMCADRIAEGDAPVCVAACTHGALEFGDRDALIEKARVLIHDHPDRYRDHIWGEAEWGGTCIIYISSEDLNALGWPSPSTHAPISALTDPLIHATPIVGISIFLGSVGLGAIIARRNKLMNQAKRPSDVNTAADADTDADRQEAGDAE